MPHFLHPGPASVGEDDVQFGKRLGHPLGVLRSGGKLIAVVQLQHPDAPAFIAVIVRQMIDHRLHALWLQLQGQGQPLGGDRFSRCK